MSLVGWVGDRDEFRSLLEKITRRKKVPSEKPAGRLRSHTAVGQLRAEANTPPQEKGAVRKVASSRLGVIGLDAEDKRLISDVTGETRLSVVFCLRRSVSKFSKLRWHPTGPVIG